MALETWLIKVKIAVSNGLDAIKLHKTSTKKSNVRVLAFEIAGFMSKLIHLWHSLSEKNIHRLHHESISLEGVHKIVSNDDTFLLSLACAEMVQNLRLLAKSVSRLSKRCNPDSGLQCFDRLFEEFSSTGLDPNGWVLGSKEMELKLKKMDRYVTLTMTLRKEMDELSEIEHGLKKLLIQCTEPDLLIKQKKIADLQQKLFWHKQEVKHLKEISLWGRSFDTINSILARSVFTILARIKVVFGVGPPAIHLPRSLSVSAMVYPSETTNTTTTSKFVSGPLESDGIKEILNGWLSPKPHIGRESRPDQNRFLESDSKILKPPPSTLGAAALALHYSNLIIVIEKMIRSPQLVGVDARDDLYAMLPTSIRVSLRARLRGVGFSANDPVLAGEWRDALGRILGWLSPLAHNMIKWQNERSFEQQNLLPKTNVLLFQTLYFANQAKTEAAITELLVGLNYIWRYEREMSSKAFLEGSNLPNLQTSG
ncbi:protein PSK SIMULATOR 3-like [Macadamia integrifolia]|uniref:protein PSK SIMULATOR 3-like n=1 Tax=Macadamia integrifolia TaxID=60698 RepID=UPI001C4F5383|nr:protein PSK SIMULATOR 3-like [Macadamia integrifolia]